MSVEAADLGGAWRRLSLTAPDVEDHATRVHWLQSGALFVDLRVPADQPALAGARALADLGPSDLAALLRAEGFAGDIAVEGSVCEWRRRINWHGRPEGHDRGALAWTPEGELIEDGVEAPYREVWRREDADPGQATRFRLGPLDGWLIETDRRFAYGLGRPDASSTAALRARLAEGHRPREALARHFEGEYGVGCWEGSEGVVEHSTNPLRVGRAALRRDGDGRHLVRLAFDGTERVEALGRASAR